MQLLWIASLVFALIIALFAAQNTTPVSVSFLVWRTEGMPTSILVLASAVLGALLTYLLGLARDLRQRVAQRREAPARPEVGAPPGPSPEETAPTEPHPEDRP